MTLTSVFVSNVDDPDICAVPAVAKQAKVRAPTSPYTCSTKRPIYIAVVGATHMIA